MRLRKAMALITALGMLSMTTACQGLSGSAETSDANFPSDPIKMVVGFSPGGGMDVMARALGAASEGPLGVPVTVENRDGAGGTIANAAVLQSRPDGQTVTVGHTGSSILTPAIAGSPSWESFEPVALIHAEEEFLFISPDAEWSSIEEVISYAKANPGEFTVGATPVGGIDSLVSIQLQQEAGVEFKYVPFDSGGDAVLALMAGDTDMYIGNLGEISENVKAGKIVPVAVASEERSEVADVPTLSEVGYDVNFQQWRGVFAPKGTPASRVDALADGFKAAMQEDEWLSYSEQSRSIDRFMGPEQFRGFLESEEKRFLPLVEDLGLEN